MAGISFESFMQKANEILQSQNSGSQAIGLEGKGKLGTYTVSSLPMTKEDKIRFDNVKQELTAALTEKFSVDNPEKLPPAIQDMLKEIQDAGRLTAEDVQKLGESVKADIETRESFAAECFEQGASVGESITQHLKELTGEDISLPLRCPLSEMLNDTYVQFMQGKMSLSSDSLRQNHDALGREFKSLLQSIVDEAFKKDGVLAKKLGEVKDKTISSFEKVLVDFVPEGGKPLAPPPGTLDTVNIEELESYSLVDNPPFEGALAQPKAVASEDSTDRAQLKLEADSNKKWFEAQLRELSGDKDFNLKLPRNSAVLAHMNSLFKVAKNVGDIRESFKELFKLLFTGTSKDQKVPLAQSLREDCKGRSTGAKRLIIHDALMRDGIPLGGTREIAALGATIRRALDDLPVRQKLNASFLEDMLNDDYDYSAADVPEPLAWSSETREQIIFLANQAQKAETKAAQCLMLRELVDAIKTDDVEKIDKMANAIGFEHQPTPKEMSDKLNGYTENNILAALEKTHSELLDKDDFRLYLDQCLGAVPIDIKDGKQIFRMGGWDVKPDYVRAVYAAIKESQINGTGVYYGQDVYDKPISKKSVTVRSVNDFRNAFGLTRDNEFKTSVFKTKGHLYLDNDGMLHSANRHFGTTVPATCAQNWQIRAELLDAFRREGADEKFLANARKMLGLDTAECVKPLSRQTVKFLLVSFGKPNLAAKAESKVTVSKKNDSVKSKEPPVSSKVKVASKTTVKTSKITATKTSPSKINTNVSSTGVNFPKLEGKLPKDIDVPQIDKMGNDTKHLIGIFKRLATVPQLAGDNQPMPFAQLQAKAEQLAHKANRPEPAIFDYLQACIDPSIKLKGINFSNLFASSFKWSMKDYLPELKGDDISNDKIKANLTFALELGKDINNPEDALNSVILCVAIRLLNKPKPSDELMGKLRQMLVNALVGMRTENKLHLLYDLAIVQNGGGLQRETSWSFAEGGKEYISYIKPQSEVNKEFKVDTSKRKLPLTGLSRTELRDSAHNNTSIMRMLRFGEVGAIYNRNSPDVIKDMYRNLVEQTFLANPNLVSQAQNGDKTKIEVPVVRLDFGGHEVMREPPEDFKFTFTPPGGSQVTVTLQPKVAHFCLPIDSLHKQGNTLFSEFEIKSNNEAWNMLKAKADTYQGPNSAAVKQLRDQIDNYMHTIFDGHNKYIMPFEGFGGELARLGGRIGALTALLGDVPSINCNWGRDRTGVMDNECKLVMHKIQTGQPLSNIRLNANESDPDIALRTRMITETGNWELAHQVNYTSHKLNLNQFRDSFMVGNKKIETTGLSSLFHKDKIGQNSITDEELVQKLLGKQNVKIKDNKGGGSCFFYSAIQQLGKREYPDTQEGALKLRQDFIAHAKQRLGEMNKTGYKGPIVNDNGEICLKNPSGENQSIDEGVKLINTKKFEEYGQYASLSHGAFLADMAQRPVIIVTNETNSSITFDRDLVTNEQFKGDPIIIFYNRGASGFGHFRAVSES